MLDINPFHYTIAEDRYFVGRENELNEWRKRLTSGSEEWKKGRHWLILASGGMGKSSLLAKIRTISEKEFKAHVVEVDFGQHRLYNDPESLFSDLKFQVAGAPDLGSRARKIVKLPPDASQAELIYQYAAELLKITGLSVALSPLVSISPDLPILKKEWPADFALQIAGIYSGLKEISKRGKRPVVVLIDQLDKAHDSELWVYLARLLLACMHKFRLDRQPQIVFAVAMRRDGFADLEGKLWQQQQQGAFDSFYFFRQYLHPFSQEEASLSIQKRAPGQIPAGLKRAILHEIETEGGFDPYRVVEAASAVWAYLYGGEHQRSATEVNPEEIHLIITNYYKEITQHFRRWNTQWQILRLLTNRYPFGLSTSEIAKELTGSEISQDIEDAIAQLLAQPKYPIIYEYEPSCYLIAHELLQKALYDQFPEEDQLIDQARKTYENAVWRYQYKGDSLSNVELKTIWEFRNQLSFVSIGWESIASTLIRNWQPDRIDWLIQYPFEISSALQKVLRRKVDNRFAESANLIIACLHKEEQQRIYAAKMVLTHLSSKNFIEDERLQAAEGLARLGETQLARDVLTDLAVNNSYESVRWQAAKAMAGLGDADRDVLADLARNSPHEYVSVEAAIRLAGLRETQIARDVLAGLVRDSMDERVRLRAAEGLVVLGETQIARNVLADLARDSPQVWVRLRAAEGLAGLGETQIARDTLTDLIRNRPQEWARRQAAEGLAGLGETQIARDVLADLARNSFDNRERWQAAEGLAGLGEAARDVLADLARNSSDEDVRRQAAEGLAGLGEAARDVLVDLARNSPDENVRWKAAEGLAGLGEKQTARVILVDLVSNSSHEEVRVKAAKGLAGLGETQIARDVLVDLAWSNSDSAWQAATALAGLGEAARIVLVDLARNSPDESVRWEAAEGLAGLGEKIYLLGSALEHISISEIVLQLLFMDLKPKN